MPAAGTTRFALDYRPDGRRLTLKERAARLEPRTCRPTSPRPALAYLCPSGRRGRAGPRQRAFPEAAIGVGAQGWCRVWDRDGTVTMRPWPDPRPVLARAQALFLSSDDVAGWEERAIELYQEVPLGRPDLRRQGGGPVRERPAARRPGGTGARGRADRGRGRLRRGLPRPLQRSRAIRSRPRPYAAVAGALTVEASGIAGVPTAEQLAGRWQASQPR